MPSLPKDSGPVEAHDKFVDDNEAMTSDPTSFVAFDVAFARSQFPAFVEPSLDGWSFFENAGGSYACADTIDALTAYYRQSKVQPYSIYPASNTAGEAMDRSHERWAEALGVSANEVHFGPSTSANTYVLANAIQDLIGPGDEVIVTNQDHEANTGAIRRAAEAAGATLREWRTDPATGLLDIADLLELLNEATSVVTFPHCSNVIGQENDVSAICAAIREFGAISIVDGVSFVPHSIPDVGALRADVYLFSLYKVYSVHLGLMVIRESLAKDLPNQAHFFNHDVEWKRMNPAGPDHAQVASADAVLDYIVRLDEHHRSGPIPQHHESTGLRASCDRVSTLWQQHESALLAPLLAQLVEAPNIRILGPTQASAPGELHRCPTVAIVVDNPEVVAASLVENNIMTSSGHYYAVRVLQGVGVNPEPGVVRLSWVHYTDESDMCRLQSALDQVLRR